MIKNGELPDADDVNSVTGKMFANYAQLLFNAKYIGFNAKLAYPNAAPTLKNISYDVFGSDSMTKSNFTYDSTNKRYISNGITIDSGSNAYSLINNGLTSVTGKINQAADFADTTDQLYITSSHTGLDFGSGDWSIAFWIKTTSTTGGTNEILSNRSGGWLGGYAVTLSNGTITWNANGVGITVATGVNDGNWHHIAIKRSGTTVTPYLDSAGGSTGTDANNYTAGTFSIGTDNESVDHYSSAIMTLDDLRIWKGYAVSNADVATIYNSGSGTETTLSGHAESSWFKFNTGTTCSITSSAVTASETITNAILVCNNTLTSSTFELSADNGSNYEEVTPNVIHYFSNTGTQLKVRIATTATGEVTEYAVIYNIAQ